jgi:hypothetical protein
MKLLTVITIEPCQTMHQAKIVELILTIQANAFDIPITLNDQPDLQNIPAFYQKMHRAKIIISSARLYKIEKYPCNLFGDDSGFFCSAPESFPLMAVDTKFYIYRF